MFKKGKSGNPHGRQKGSRNKFTSSAKEAFQFAFNKLGGADDLARWAVDNKTEFYKLFARLIPTEIEGGTDSSLTIKIMRFADDKPAK